MRLLNARTLKVEEFLNDATRPPFAILSHTWGKDEVTFQDIQSLGRARLKSGFEKIQFTCKQALQDGLTHAWVDTCCIDKSSSAELSEAINSMFQWYKESTVCYAFLADVHDTRLSCTHGRGAFARPIGHSVPEYNPTTATEAEKRFVESRWFSRGWTLQELIAPAKVVFFGPNWSYLGELIDIPHLVSHASRIPTAILTKQTDLFQVSAAKRMSWAATRQTTKIEDEAYSLLGLFNVNLNLLYGEGRKAFRRLQEHIAVSTNDHSILAWRRTGVPSAKLTLDQPIFAPGVSDFADCGHITRLPPMQGENSCIAKSNGVRLRLRLHVSGGDHLVMLDCFDARAPQHCLALSCHNPLYTRGAIDVYPLWVERRVLIDRKRFVNAPYRAVTLQHGVLENRYEGRVYLRLSGSWIWSRWAKQVIRLRVRESYPSAAWDEGSYSWSTNMDVKNACIIEIERTIPNFRTGRCQSENFAFRLVFTHAEPRALDPRKIDSSRESGCRVWVSLDDGRELADCCRSEYELIQVRGIRLGPDTAVRADFLHGAGSQILSVSIFDPNLLWFIGALAALVRLFGDACISVSVTIITTILKLVKDLLVSPMETYTRWTIAPTSIAERRFGGINWSDDLTSQVRYIRLQRSAHGRKQLRAQMRANNMSMGRWLKGVGHVSDVVKDLYKIADPIRAKDPALQNTKE